MVVIRSERQFRINLSFKKLILIILTFTQLEYFNFYEYSYINYT
jgi:hypothetical protein